MPLLPSSAKRYTLSGPAFHNIPPAFWDKQFSPYKRAPEHFNLDMSPIPDEAPTAVVLEGKVLLNLRRIHGLQRREKEQEVDHRHTGKGSYGAGQHPQKLGIS